MPKQIKFLILSAIAVIILGGALFYAQPKTADHSTMASAPANKSLKLAIEPPEYDFGTISMKNGLVTKSFNVKNTQSEPVFLSELFTSCMCTLAKLIISNQEYGPFGMQGHGAMKMLNQQLAAGQAAELQVTYDPNAHGPSGIGQIERSVTIQSDQGETVSVNIKANVTP